MTRAISCFILDLMQSLIGICKDREIWKYYDWLRSVVQPKLRYIPKGKEWRYKTNVLNAMLNNYEPKYLPVIQKACYDEYGEVRDMARWVLNAIID